MKISIVTTSMLLAAVGVVSFLAGCGAEEECQSQGENCSSAYKEANDIDYGCCDDLSCSEGESSGVLICQ